MFPEFDENSIPSEPQDAAKTGTSFLFDFDKGDFVTVDGKLIKIDGIEAVKIWIEKVLRTEKFKFKIYESTGYGICLSDFVNGGYPLDFMEVEIEREIREALEKNPDIQRVHSFLFSREKRALACSFTADTKYGQAGGEVKI